MQSQHSTGDKRSYDVNSNIQSKEITTKNQTYDGTIKKRKSEIEFSHQSSNVEEEETEPILQRILRQIFHINKQNQSFINDLIESSGTTPSTRRIKSILSDVFLRCLTSTDSNLMKSLIG
mgnify:FL=1